MKYFFSLMMAICLLSCDAQQSSKQANANTPIYQDVNNQAAAALMEDRSNLQIIDVRTDDEVAEGMIDGARQMDIYGDDFEANLKTLDKNAPVLVYCRSGGRSQDAQDKMEEMGFKEVYNLEDGYSGWKQ